MAHFRAKKLDLGCYVNIRVIRDHTKRKVFAQFETERYVAEFCFSTTRTQHPLLFAAAVFFFSSIFVAIC